MRNSNPKLFTHRMVNLGLYGAIGMQSMFHAPAYLHTYVKVHIDGEKISLPKNIMGLLVLNLPSWAGGINPWGADKKQAKSKKHNYTPQSYNDARIEVIGLKGALHLGTIRAGIENGKRLGQGQTVRVVTSRPTPAQVDGEPWMLNPSVVEVIHHGQVKMLARRTPAPPPAPTPVPPSDSSKSSSSTSISSSSPTAATTTGTGEKKRLRLFRSNSANSIESKRSPAVAAPQFIENSPASGAAIESSTATEQTPQPSPLVKSTSRTSLPLPGSASASSVPDALKALAEAEARPSVSPVTDTSSSGAPSRPRGKVRYWCEKCNISFPLHFMYDNHMSRTHPSLPIFPPLERSSSKEFHPSETQRH
eukprot:TRINITY_DN2741_c0_g1_i1.p1 TRINITY_DN2741_c0_g1~~TRINITY_DN2741_c0_g1_i1.p1  ORF type:complete len:411 (-),score=77.59 TRINITY_DN2741_c0_g1_i1:92-1180(-)